METETQTELPFEESELLVLMFSKEESCCLKETACFVEGVSTSYTSSIRPNTLVA